METGRASRKSWVDIVQKYLWHPRVLIRQAEALEAEIFDLKEWPSQRSELSSMFPP